MSRCIYKQMCVFNLYCSSISAKDHKASSFSLRSTLCCSCSILSFMLKSRTWLCEHGASFNIWCSSISAKDHKASFRSTFCCSCSFLSFMLRHDQKQVWSFLGQCTTLGGIYGLSAGTLAAWETLNFHLATSNVVQLACACKVQSPMVLTATTSAAKCKAQWCL